MTAPVRAHSEPPARASFTPAPVGLARRCACGGVPGPSGECESCRRKRQGTPARSAQRRSASPGLRRAADPGGALEREADSVAAAVVDGRAALPVRRRPVPRDVQRQEARPGPAPATSFPAQQTLSPEHDLEQWKRVLDEVLKATPGEALRRLETTRVGKKLEKFLDTPTGKAVAGAVVTGAVASAITINALLQESAGEPKGRVPSGEFVPKVPPLALDFPEARAPGKPPPPPTKAVTPGPLAPTAAGEANDAFMSWYVQQSLRERDDLMERTRDAAGELGGAVDRMTAFRIWLDLLGRPEGEKRSVGTGRAATPSFQYQFKRASPSTDDVDPEAVEDGLRSHGRSLDAGLRSQMESRFGHDFGSVRVHTDERAAASAAAADAHAYAVGGDIVFGHGRFAPETREGRLLLAHELTHVVQQGAAGRAAMHAPAGFQAQTASAPAPSRTKCSERDRNTIVAAAGQALERIGRARALLAANIVRGQRIGHTTLAFALHRHFSSADADTAQSVLNQLGLMYRFIVSGGLLRGLECHDESDLVCDPDVPAYWEDPRLVACPASLETDVANVLIHESAHAVGIKPEEKPTDYAYRHERIYRALPTEHALKNADSYASFVRDIWFGVQPLGIPADVSRGCPDDWWTAFKPAVALAERWNRAAWMETTAPDRYARWADARAKYLSDPGPAGITQARRLFSSVAHRLSEPLQLSCLVKGGDFCTSPAVFSISPPTVYVCPAWKGMEPDGHAMWVLAALYGLLGGEANWTRRRAYALLARRLHELYFLEAKTTVTKKGTQTTTAVPEGPGTPHTGDPATDLDPWSP